MTTMRGRDQVSDDSCSWRLHYEVLLGRVIFGGICFPFFYYPFSGVGKDGGREEGREGRREEGINLTPHKP